LPNPNIPIFVRKQLELRREANIRRFNNASTPHITNYQNGKTAWIRMSSGVNIVDPDLANSFGVGVGNQLAKNKILQSGELYITPEGKYVMRAAIGNMGGAYGDAINGNRGEYGIRPMAGIKSITIDGISSQGGTRNATIKYYCWSKKELDALLLLYARIGHSILLEWGWSQYFQNPSNNETIKTYKFDKLESKINYYNILDDSLIEEQIYRDIFDYTLESPQKEINKNDKIYNDGYKPRKLMEQHSGNYEAFYGRVKNFNWKEVENGGYEITTVMMGVGEFINSHKAEYSSKVDVGKLLNISSVTPAQKIDFYEGKLFGTLSEIFNKSKDAVDASKELFNNFYLKLDTLKELNIKKRIPVITARVSVNSTTNFEVYIRFNELVEIINQFMLIYINNNAPIFKISLQDNAYDDIECNAHYLQMSADISKCIIKQCDSDSLVPKTLKYSYFDKTSVEPDDVNFFVKDKKYSKGLLKNVYLNINYLKKVIDNSKSKDGILLYDYLMNILKDIQISLGDINDFSMVVDHYSNIVRIIDRNNVIDDLSPDEYENLYQLDLNGATSVVRSYNLESMIDSRTAQSMAIASAGLQNGAADITNSDYKVLNFGTENRHVRASGEKIPKATLTVEKNAEIQKDLKNLEAMLKYVYATKFLNLDRNNLKLGDLSVALKELIVQEIALYSTADDTIADFYAKRSVPIRMNLTMDGIGGLNLGQVFRISDDKLPIGYGFSKNKKNRIAFKILNISQTIDNNDWKLDVQAQIAFVKTNVAFNLTASKIFQNSGLNDVNSPTYKNLMASYLK
jgi:hypothetical protein